MPTPEEIARRKALKNASRRAEQDQLRESLPITPELMKELFEYVDKQLSNKGCDDTLHHTLTFLKTRVVSPDATVAWLEDQGGYCDCEVLANSEEKFQFAFPEFSD